MRRVLVALALAGLFAGSAVAATLPRGTVTVTAQRYPLICGRPSGLLKVVFPATAAVPAKIAPSAVTVNGRVASSVTVEKRTVSVVVPRRPGMTCMSIVLGKLTVAFAPHADVKPRTARTATVVHGTAKYAARVG